jgi:hypothetical protein
VFVLKDGKVLQKSCLKDRVLAVTGKVTFGVKLRSFYLELTWLASEQSIFRIIHHTIEEILQQSLRPSPMSLG